MRIGLYNDEGDLRIVGSTEGEDLETWTPIDVPDGYPGQYRWDAPTRTFIADWLETHQRLWSKIDEEAGRLRQQFITTSPGQEMTYLTKEMEARAWTMASTPDQAPMLVEEAAVRGITIEEMAAFVIQTANEWRQLGAWIEGKRIGAKEAVKAAVDLAAKEAAADIDWTLPQAA